MHVLTHVKSILALPNDENGRFLRERQPLGQGHVKCLVGAEAPPIRKRAQLHLHAIIRGARVFMHIFIHVCVCVCVCAGGLTGSETEILEASLLEWVSKVRAAHETRTDLAVACQTGYVANI